MGDWYITLIWLDNGIIQSHLFLIPESTRIWASGQSVTSPYISKPSNTKVLEGKQHESFTLALKSGSIWRSSCI